MNGWNPLLFAVVLAVISYNYMDLPVNNKAMLGLAYFMLYVIASVLFSIANRRARWYRALLLVWGLALLADLIIVIPFSMINGTAFPVAVEGFVAGFPMCFTISLVLSTFVFALGWHEFGKAWLSNCKPCTSCRGELDSPWSYCPHCGARVIVDA